MKAKKKVTARSPSMIELRLPKETHASLSAVAKVAGVPLNNVVKLALAEGIMRHRDRVKPVAAAIETEVEGARFTNLDAGGKPTSGEHVAVHDRVTGLTWSAAPLLGGKELNHADSMKACAALDLLGQKDWRTPTITELLSIVDYDRHDPAVDTAHFKGPFGWTWTSTPYKGNSGAAWVVSLSLGGSDWSGHDDRSHARAVRAGQPLGLLE